MRAAFKDSARYEAYLPDLETPAVMNHLLDRLRPSRTAKCSAKKPT